MSDWWSKKLGVPQQPPPPRPDPRMVPQYAQPPQYQQQQYQQPQGYPQQQPPVPVTPDGKINVMDAVSTWQGDPNGAAGNNVGPCPNCGSEKYMASSRGAVTTQNGVVYPSPDCFECGWPRLQQGSGSGQISTAKSTGPVRASRQGEIPAQEFLASLPIN
jgi:hypothetical protein